MNYINIEKLKILEKKYSKLVDDYKNLFNDYYFELKFVNNYWESTIANYFVNLINIEEKNNKKLFNNFLSLNDIIKYIIKNYSSLSNEKIMYNFKNEDILIDKINRIEFNSIINKYDIINNTKYKNEIQEHIRIIKNQQNNLLKYKVDVEEFFYSVDEIEHEIYIKLQSFEFLKLFEENSHNQKEIGDPTTIKSDTNKLSILSQKIKMFLKDFECNYSDIKDILDEITNYYKTNNTDSMEKVIENIITTYSINLKNFYNNYYIINYNVEELENVNNYIINIMNEN